MANEKLDVIDRKALLAKYDRVHIGEPGKARKLIEEAPSVEAVPVVWRLVFVLAFASQKGTLFALSC